MTQGPPIHVQLARLAHSLETVRLYLKNGDTGPAANELDAARELVTRLQGSV